MPNGQNRILIPIYEVIGTEPSGSKVRKHPPWDLWNLAGGWIPPSPCRRWGNSLHGFALVGNGGSGARDRLRVAARWLTFCKGYQ